MDTPSDKQFSVIIALYNHKQYLPQLVEALASQTFKDFEVIFCDDGSNDGTKEYFKYAGLSFDFKYLRQFHWGMRLAKNVNQGIKSAKGKYCVFIMGDSFPEKNYLEVLNEWIREDRVLCGVRANIEEKRVVGMDWRLKKQIIPNIPALLVREPFNAITGNGLVTPRVEWNEKLKGYGGDDQELAARLYYQGYLIYSVPTAILYHHYHLPQKGNNARIVNKFIQQYAR
ncbi:MAG: Glycosyl transferase family 2 [Parcubacteria group bacterium GW2011_GWC1_39_29]|nr:MAG: Glycosyl transferase family 2 [Parcubacteria group bacterium GW2011_GWC1_39_29]